ncbi:unnamed protein product [Cyprideis torosa]|uniref:Uncharacterized protein n=1 Tax=Cyprideis torosa TaxID=163714 RepID=A0A7R8WG81_9CRUS|nr:unnamed protein product [Cyprideis torosa]CAG0895011.1 unnamed protein product [Cyprideis torosa]
MDPGSNHCVQADESKRRKHDTPHIITAFGSLCRWVGKQDTLQVITAFGSLCHWVGKQDTLQIIDGWEWAGEFFPSFDDHPLPMRMRFDELCEGTRQMIMHQNAAQVSYKLSGAQGELFLVRIRHRKNPQPCSALLVSDEAEFKLESTPGRPSNCTVVAMFPIAFLVEEIDFDKVSSIHHYPDSSEASALKTNAYRILRSQKQCNDPRDGLQILGGNGLASTHMKVFQTICDNSEAGLVSSVICGTSAVRFSSSGKRSSSVRFIIGFASGAESSLKNAHDQMTSPSSVSVVRFKNVLIRPTDQPVRRAYVFASFNENVGRPLVK